MDNLFLRGLILGFSIAAPVGPIGILCIQRTLTRGQRYGFMAGLGAATADAVYGSLAALGLTTITVLLTQQMGWLQIGGGLFLCYLGIKTLRARQSTVPTSQNTLGWGGAYASTFILTLTNPMTILSFAAIFAGLGLAQQQQGYASAGLLVGGVFCGSAMWWLLLSSGTHLLRHKFDAHHLSWINKAAGVIIIILGVTVLLQRLSP